jgi:membrane protease YdiL (CAAX protease family)
VTPRISTAVLAAPAPRRARALLLLAALAAASLVRAAINGHSVTSALLAGSGFGAALVALAALAGWRPERPRLRSVVVGVAGGLVLLAMPRLVGSGIVIRIGLSPEPFGAWLFATVLVAAGEELLLRGVLLDQIEAGGGFVTAVLVTSAAFALMHVPLYGWGVVPLDFGVGVWFVGVRLAGGGIAAPVIAHAIADIATWWM